MGRQTNPEEAKAALPSFGQGRTVILLRRLAIPCEVAPQQSLAWFGDPGDEPGRPLRSDVNADEIGAGEDAHHGTGSPWGRGSSTAAGDAEVVPFLEAASETRAPRNRKNGYDKYPTISKQWRLKWPHILLRFELPAPLRKTTYTTNVIESVNSVIRKFTRNRKQHPHRDSALKLISMAIHEASGKWTMPIPKWKEAFNHFAILFADRMPNNLN